MTDLIERLRGGKCPECAGWGEVAYFGEMVGCTCLGRYETPISMETRTEAADEIAALRARVAELEAQLLANKEADLDRHIFAWFNDHDCDEMRRCLETYDARQGRAILSKQEPEYSGWVEVVDEGGSP